MSLPDRMPTGIRGLDQLLEGGLVRENSLLIEGQPGSGKSTLGVRMLYEGARAYGEPGLLITFEEFPRQIYGETASCGMDLPALEQAGKLRVLWTPPARIFDNFRGKSDLIESIVKQMGVRRILIDSITHFKRLAATEAELREMLSTILTNLKLMGVNAILIKELEGHDHQHIAFEEYLVDASLRLYMESGDAKGSGRRQIEVRKTRGQGHVAGRHPFRLDSTGLSIFPRYRRRDISQHLAGQVPEPTGRVPSGVAGLDSMLGGGFAPGEAATVCGYAGSGKSVLAQHFADAALQRGESALWLSFRGDSAAALRSAQALHMDWTRPLQEGRLLVHYHHPLEVTLEEVILHLLDTVRGRRPDRFVCDSIGSLAQLARSPQELRDQLGIIVDILAASRTTALFIQEADTFSGEPGADQQWFSQTVATIVKLSIAETDGVLRRFIAVAKHAESDHAKDLREVEIDSHGLRVAQRTTPLAGVLTGQAHPAARSLSAQILPALADLHESLAALRSDLADPAAVSALADQASRQAWVVDRQLREYFGGVSADDGPATPTSPAVGRRVLVAEDNEFNARVAVRLLEKLGHQVEVVRDGLEAVRALEQASYDLVLMDVQMPNLNGLEATTTIRHRGSAVLDHEVPILALTAAASAADHQACLAAGMNDYLSKPLEPAELAAKVARWLG